MRWGEVIVLAEGESRREVNTLHFSPPAKSCQLALLEMSRFTVINLQAQILDTVYYGWSWCHLNLLQHVFHWLSINPSCNINMETVKETVTCSHETSVGSQIMPASREALGIKLMFSVSIMERHCSEGFGQIRRIRGMISLQCTFLMRILFGARMMQDVITRLQILKKQNGRQYVMMLIMVIGTVVCLCYTFMI